MAVSPLPAGTGLATDASGRARFVVERPVAQTAFGVTYLGRHAALNAAVAIKEFAPAAMCSRQPGGQVVVQQEMKPDFARMKARFVREGQTMHGIQHPNVVQALDCWREADTAYIATRWVEQGEPLDFRLASKLTLPQRHQLLLQLLDALQAVHAKGILHNDVKPANVLVSAQQQVVLIDFGVARQEAELTANTRHAMFTWGWAAPEIMDPASLPSAGGWSDLYAWGLMAFEVFVGHGPSGPIAPTKRLLGKDPYADAEAKLRAVGLNDVWTRSIVACMSVPIGQRPSSTQDLLRMLHGALPVGVAGIAPWAGGTLVRSGLPAKPGSLVMVCAGCGAPSPPTGKFCIACGLPLAGEPVIQDVVGHGLMRARLAAAALDLVVVIGATWVFMEFVHDGRFVRQLNLNLEEVLLGFSLALICAGFVWYGLVGLFCRGSVGKLLFRLQVRTRAQEEASPRTLILRALLQSIGLSVFGLGWLWALTNPKRWAAHDYLSKTCVVRIPKGEK